MSYSFSTSPAREALRSDLDTAVARVEASTTDAEPERHQHLVAILGAIETLADVVGRPGDDVSVSVSGHANPGHAPRDGWSDEVITITVAAGPRPEPTEG